MSDKAGTVKSKKPKLRPATRFFKIGSEIRAWFVIELLHGRRWGLLGDEDGEFRFATEAERDEKLDKLRDLMKAA